MNTRIIKRLVSLGALSAWLGTGFVPFASGQHSCCVALSAPPASAINVGLTAWQSPDHYFDVQVTTAPAAIPPGHYNGWCVEERVDIGVYGGATLTPYNGQVFSSCDPNLNAYLINEPAATNGNWQAVNYILNNRAGYSYSDVQASIWYFVGSGTPPSPTPYYGDGDGSPYVFHPTQANVDALVGAALSNMAAWVAA